MKTLRVLLFTNLIWISACHNPRPDTKTFEIQEQSKYPLIDSIPNLDNELINNSNDTISKFLVDDYPITENMLLSIGKINPFFILKAGKCVSLEKAWFYNDTINQIIVIQLATDYHRFLTYHFAENDFPKDIIEEIGFEDNKGEIASLDQIIIDLNGFVKQASKIDASYFTSNKGIRIGDIKQKAIDIYGTPDNKLEKEQIEKLEWEFEGDGLYDPRQIPNGKKIAKDSFGHKVVMYFRNGHLIGQILINDIP